MSASSLVSPEFERARNRIPPVPIITEIAVNFASNGN